MALTSDDKAFIDQATRILENPGFLMRMSAFLGRPIELVVDKIPGPLRSKLEGIVHKALHASLAVALKTVRSDSTIALGSSPSAKTTALKKWAHTAAAMGLGATSGAVGGWALAVELPLTTTLMMRSIAQMAQDAGFDPQTPEVALQILTVFAYASPQNPHDDLATSTFFVQRAAFDRLIKDSARFIVGKTATQVLSALEAGSVPRLVELMARISIRMNLLVSEKALAQTLPVLGAAGGAALNAMFNEYYSNIAYYVFGLRRLERLHGSEIVQAAYERSAEQQRLTPKKA